jgi:glyoxylase-like metal-dependent hydrolase (beta-lactamase superfamily II)
MELNRRRLMIAGAALPLAAPFVSLGGLGLAGAARAQEAGAAGAVEMPTHRQFRVGEFGVTALLAGGFPIDAPHEVFGLNVDDATFAAVSAENFVSPDFVLGPLQPTLVDTGSARILFDTGVEPAGLLRALGAAGRAPADVTHVVLTHLHPDHVGGLTDEAGAPTFPEAAYVTGQAEFDFWAAQGDELFEAKVRPLAERMTFVAEGGEAAPGVSAVEAFGHTPGHMAWRLDSGGQALLITADTANHHVWSLAHPDWEVLFDADKAQAAATRRRIFGMLAADRMGFAGYHMPFPGLGFVEPRGDGFHFVAESGQFM